MKIEKLITGCSMLLKKERAQAYNINTFVTFVRIQERAGYKTPWILGTDSTGSIGHFKPSDFK
jgi:hypothetical protein